MKPEKLALYRDASDAWGLVEGEALAALATLPDASVDAVITDPPYGIGFRGELWDRVATYRHWTCQWAAACGRVLKPGGHLIAFGAPRTFHRLVAGVEDAGLEVRDQLLWLYAQGLPKSHRLPGGQGTALKPAYEPILLARKPLHTGLRRNLEDWGTGALNIEASSSNGYWPANLATSHAPSCSQRSCADDCPVRLIDAARPDLLPSRLFFCAKATKREREAGCEHLPLRRDEIFSGGAPRLRRNIHPTVKPLELMRWLARLVVPAGGLVLDPFAGSGSTGVGAVMEGRTFLGLEREGDYVDIACARLTHWAAIAAQEQVLP
jgi:DNA modification methylase